jgi:hypothetical protein
MSQCPPIEPSERPGRPRVRSLGRLLALGCLLGTAACGSAVPTGSGIASPAAETTPDADGSGAAQPDDVGGLVVLTGGVLAIGTSDGLLVGLDGPGGALSAFSAANGRLVVQTAEPGFSIADVQHGGTAVTWRPVEMAATEVSRRLSAPALAPVGNLLAFAAADPETTGSFEVFVIDLTKRDRRSQSAGLDR